MMRTLLLLFLLALPGLAKAPTGASVNQLATQLYAGLVRANPQNSLFFSPYSLSVALAMTAGGARGETRAELDRLVGEVPIIPGLQQANRVWLEQTRQLLPDFLKHTASFGAEAERVDFFRNTEAARQTINKWVARQTADKIPELIPQRALSDATLLVLTNAVYFKESWKHAFAPASTVSKPFHLLTGGTTEVQMMSQSAPLNYGTAGEVAVCELPYAGNFSMTIVLPNKPAGLPDVEAGLTSQQLQGYLAALQPAPKVHVEVPRFRTESSYQLKPQLEALGLKLSFTQQADFSGMTGTNNLQLGEVFHGGFIDVNEQGTEAAAATAVSVILRNGSGPPTPSFRCDHPFLYLIRHQPTGTIVFMGRFVKP